MEFVKVFSILFAALFTISASFAGFIDNSYEVVTIHNCEKTTEFSAPIGECEPEVVYREFSMPEKRVPTTILRPVNEVSEVEVVEVSTVDRVHQNVKFGEIHCEDCVEGLEVEEYSKPQSVEKQSVMTSITQYIISCFR